MRKIAVVTNTDKPMALETTAKLIEWLEARGLTPALAPRAAALLGRTDLGLPDRELGAGAELIIVLGGDGTLIRAAQAMAPLQIPVLGVNTGHLGFLTELENAEFFDQLGPILDGQYRVEERLMLSVTVEREGAQIIAMTALNDAVVSKGPRARLAHLGVSVGGTVVARYPADGVIIATPTGSTAYSLSAGGPIVSPTVDVMLITPICPHTMAARTILVSGEEQVTVCVLESPGEVGLSADGSEPIPLYPGDIVRVGQAPFSARLVRRFSYQFYDVLRRKLADPVR